MCFGDSGRRQHATILSASADDLQSDGQAVAALATGNGDRWYQTMIEERREDRVPARPDLDAIDAFGPEPCMRPGHARRGWTEQQIVILEEHTHRAFDILAGFQSLRNVGARQFQSAFDLGANVGIEGVRVAREGLTVQSGQTGGLHRHDSRFTEASGPLRIGKLDHPPGIGKRADAHLDRARHVGIDRHTEAQARAEGDAPAQRMSGRGRVDRNAFGIARMGPGDGVEQGGDIRHGAAHRGKHGDPPERFGEARTVGYRAERGLEPDRAGVCRWTPARAATVRSERDRCEIRSQRRRIATR